MKKKENTDLRSIPSLKTKVDQRIMEPCEGKEAKDKHDVRKNETFNMHRSIDESLLGNDQQLRNLIRKKGFARIVGAIVKVC